MNNWGEICFIMSKTYSMLYENKLNGVLEPRGGLNFSSHFRDLEKLIMYLVNLL